MSIGTLGLYTIYWDYLNWKLIEQVILCTIQ